MLIRSKSPFRISFGGGGTDVPPYCYEHGGAVISTTIDKYAFATITPNNNRAINVSSLDYGLEESFKIEEEPKHGKLDIIKATVNEFNVEKTFDLVTHSDMPPGSGLGTSSALTVALIGCLKEFTGASMDKYEIANLAYHIEGFNYIEFKDKVVVNPLYIPQETLNELRYRMLLFCTSKTRLSSDIQVDLVERYKKGDSVESMHNLKSIAEEMKNSLLKGNLRRFGELLHQGWIEKKSLSDKISNPEIDKLYEISMEVGAIGGKILGAGGGGYMLLFCECDKKFDVISELRKYNVKFVDFGFDKNGLQTWRVKT